MKKLNLMTVAYLTLAGCAGINGSVKSDADGELITIEKLEDTRFSRKELVPMLRHHFDSIFKKYSGSDALYNPELHQEDYTLIYNANTNGCIWTMLLPGSCEDRYADHGNKIIRSRMKEAIFDEGCDLEVDAIANILYVATENNKPSTGMTLHIGKPIEWQPKKVLDERLRSEIPNVEALDADLGVLAENFGMNKLIKYAKEKVKRQKAQQQKREGKIRQKAWNKKHR